MIPVFIDIHGYRFEIFTLVSEICENVDLILGTKNIFELECLINSRESFMLKLNFVRNSNSFGCNKQFFRNSDI